MQERARDEVCQVLGDRPPTAADLSALLALARRAGEDGGSYPCAFNAANEIAVAAFLEGRLPFLGIAATVEEVLAEVGDTEVYDIADKSYLLVRAAPGAGGIRAFVNACLHDEPIRAPGEAGLAVQKMLDGVYRSAAAGGREVAIE